MKPVHGWSRMMLLVDVSDVHLNDVGGALDRLHYAHNPCLQFDCDGKFWVYLHSQRDEVDIGDDGTFIYNEIDVIASNMCGKGRVHQTNDNSNIALIPFKLLGTENYRIWVGAMKLALQARNKYSFVDGTCLRESYITSDVLTTQWDSCNAIVLTWIMNYVSQDVYMGRVYYENVASVWKEL
ncbi:putative LTR copia-type gag-polypeptide [Tanacetum coccineum]